MRRCVWLWGGGVGVGRWVWCDACGNESVTDLCLLQLALQGLRTENSRSYSNSLIHCHMHSTA